MVSLAFGVACGSSVSPPTSPAGAEVNDPSQDADEEVSLQQLYAQVELELREGTVAEIPIVQRRSGWVVPAGAVGADAGALLLDTAGPVLLATRLIPRDESAVALGSLPTVDAVGAVAARPVHMLAGLLLGRSALFKGAIAYEGWFEEPSNALCVSDSGILGYTVTGKGAWQLDPVAQRLRIAERAEELPLEGYREFPLEVTDDGLMWLRVDIEGRELSVTVDTGYFGDIALTNADFDALFGEAEERRSLVVVANAGEQIATDRTVVRPIHVGAPDGIPLTVEVERDGSNSLIGIRALSALGGFAWEHSSSRFYLKDGTQESSVIAPWPFAPRWADGNAVVAVARPDGAAAGLREGDVLLRADDYTLEHFEGYCELIRTVTPPRTLVVERDGERVEVDLAPSSPHSE
ncbi:MAG: hypothetical protein AAGF12_16380 [Myxococcota bacterium]